MYIRAFFIAYTKSTKLVQPRKSSFDNPSMNAKSTTMFGTALCQDRLDVSFAKFFSMWFRVISSITLNSIRPLTGTALFSTNRWYGIN